MNYSRNIAISAVLAACAHAAIVDDGIWDEDWYNEDYKIGIANGVPYSDDDAVLRQITAPMPLDGEVSDYLTKANVQRVQGIIDSDEWEFLFPMRDEVYTYDGFLNAVGKFPTFCAENNTTTMTDEDMCKKELATLFAHFVVETGYNSQWLADNADMIPLWRQALDAVENQGCAGNDGSNAGCNYYGGGWTNEPEAWPANTSKQYYARGPLQLAYNYNYGRFSTVFVDGGYNSGKMHLLNNPELVAEDGFTVFSASMWFYMTPQNPKPSMHDVVTKHFQPNDVDTAAGIQGTFGTTTNILNGGVECGNGANTKATQRGEYYQEFLDHFEITDPEGGYDCPTEHAFQAGGAAALPAYFEWDWHWGSENRCMLVRW